jgi:hypothetical protein
MTPGRAPGCSYFRSFSACLDRHDPRGVEAGNRTTANLRTLPYPRVTDLSPPSTVTAQSHDPIPAAVPARRRSPFARERLAVGLVFLALVGALIVNGAAQIHRDTFRVPAASHPIARCSAEIARLVRGFDAALHPIRVAPGGGVSSSRPSSDPAVRRELQDLDEDLLALRPYCVREGADARAAYDSLTLWRHQAQDLSRLEERLIVPDAERALRYRTPESASTPSSSPPPVAPAPRTPAPVGSTP